MVNKWTVQDQYGNEIYLTGERWDHIQTYGSFVPNNFVKTAWEVYVHRLDKW